MAPPLAAQTVSKQLTTTPPPANYVISITGMSPGPGTVILQWQAISGVLSYRIERRKIDPTADPREDARRPTTPFFLVSDKHAGISYTDTGLWNDSIYEYRVSMSQFDPKASNGSVGAGRVTVTTAP
ncbi:MAG: hypothetical protein H7Z74_13945 [Anaerolineae bacterium]|nr:hypothetical protein [Gemmatimonadaceae bacterium]